MSIKEKIKNYVKENKNELIIFGVSAVIGGTLGGVLAAKLTTEEKALCNVLNTFEPSPETGVSMIEDIIWTMRDSNYAEMHKFNKSEITVKDFGEAIVNFYKENNISLDTPIKGAILFEDRK